MAVDAVGGTKGLSGTSLLTDQRARSVFFQFLVLAVVVTTFGIFIDNASTNLKEQGIASGWAFLSQPAGYDISQTLIEYTKNATYGRTYVVGLLNTLLVSGVGIVLATVLGFVLGVLRLSNNWLVSRVVYWYIEITRNIPLLLQIIFWWTVFLNLPHVKQAFVLGSGFFLSNRGFVAPMPLAQPGFELVLGALALAAVIGFVIKGWAKKRQAETGQTFPVFFVSLGLIVGLPLLAYFAAGMPLDFEIATKTKFSLKGGLTVKPEFMGLLTGLAVYTAAFIAEIVRSGIQAVSHGQTEAAYALGLKPNWTMRLIIIPQALRVIIPPLTSQYLNLTKNSSLAIAVAYPDLVSTFGGTTLNQTGQAVECLLVTMLTYLTISLIISSFMNWYNKRVALVER